MKRWLSMLLGAALLMLAASCNQSPTLGIKLGTSTISIVRGDQDTVAVTITGSSGGPVTLTISGAPSNVTAALTDVTLPAGATSTTLQLQVAAAAVEGSYTLTVHGTSGSLAASAELTLEITSLTVNGSVHGLLGDGFPGAKVAIQGMTSTTDASGAFVIGGVSVPYDVAVGVIADSHPVGQLFMGMTTGDPVLTPYGALVATAATGYYPTAAVTGNLSAVVPVGSEARVCLEGAGVAIYGCSVVDSGDTAYSFSAFWEQGSSVSFTLHALVTQLDANGVPTGYDAYGTATGSVASGGTTNVNVALGAAPSTNMLTLSMNSPAGFDPSSFEAGAELSSNFTMPVLSTFNPPSASLSVPVPQFGGATYSAMVTASPSGASAASTGWKQKIPPSSTTTFDLGAPATLIAPADGATGIGIGSRLQISSTGGVPVTFIMFDGIGPAILVTTMDSSVAIPDLTTVGVFMPAASPYNWSVIMSPTVSNMEHAAETWFSDYYGAILATQFGGPGSPLDAGAIMSTAGRDFTTP
jgi:hypothetical protein